MKALFIIQRLQLRGAEIFACQLAEELIQLGIKVDIVYLFSNQYLLKERFPALNFIPLNGAETRRFWDFPAYKKLDAIIKNNGYDVVQSNAGDTLKYAVLSRLIYRWKTRLVFRNASKMSAFLKGNLHMILNKFFLKYCDYFISVSENCRQDLIGIYPQAVRKSKTITIGTYQFDSVKPVETGTNEPIFINVGSLVAEKNHTFLVDVFKEYFDKFGKGYLWIVGNGAERQRVSDKISLYGLGERVRIWGYSENAISILKACNVMLMPSKIEGLPGVILEALSCQIPVIASNVGGIPEVIQNGVNGFCLDGFNIAQYADCMDRIVTDNELTSRFKKEGYDLIQQNYLLPQIALKFASVYESIRLR